MRRRVVAVGVAIATMAAAGALNVPQASASTATHFWFGYAGSSRVADAVAEVLIKGGSVAQARQVASELSGLTTPATSTVIAAVLGRATDDASNFATDLLYFRPESDAVSGSGKADVVAPTRAVSVLPPTPPSVTSASEPKQAKDGDPKAVSPTKWILHNNTSTPIFYGDCDPEGCTTGGYFVVNDQAYVNNAPTVTFSTLIRQGIGQVALFSDSRVRMLEDVTGKPDPLIDLTQCPTSYASTRISCSVIRDSPVVEDKWYYYQQDFTACTEISGCGDIQIQTRRWYTFIPNDFWFDAYDYGG